MGEVGEVGEVGGNPRCDRQLRKNELKVKDG